MDEDKIIAFASYDTVIQANLAKTKLDANDIPCFLTDENAANFIGFRGNLFPGIRLFIFEKDTDRARALLADEEPEVVDRFLCPNCQSKNTQVHSSESSRPIRVFLGLLLSPMLATLSPPNRYFQCNDCKHEWI